MIIVVEGQRGAGKSTVVSWVQEIMTKTTSSKVEVLKFQRGLNPAADMWATLQDLDHKRGIFIIDRFHLSEFVISTHLNRVPLPILTYTTARIHSKLHKDKSWILYVKAPLQLIIERARTRPDKEFYMPPEEEEALWQECTNRFMPTATIDTSNDPQTIKNFLTFRLTR